jgi:hypothetical protein
MDTLFIFQILFITVLLAAGLTYLHKLGFFGGPLLGMLTGIILFVDIAIIVNRSSYTAKVRDQRYWNRRQFSKKELPQVPGASVCPAAEGFASGPAMAPNPVPQPPPAPEL